MISLVLSLEYEHVMDRQVKGGKNSRKLKRCIKLTAAYLLPQSEDWRKSVRLRAQHIWRQFGVIVI